MIISTRAVQQKNDAYGKETRNSAFELLWSYTTIVHQVKIDHYAMNKWQFNPLARDRTYFS